MLSVTSPRTRLAFAVTCVLLLGAVAGCSSLPGAGGSAQAGASLDAVPANAQGVVYVDVDAMVSDDTLQQLGDAYLEQQAYGSEPKTVQGLLDEVENQTGLSIAKIDALTAFSTGVDSARTTAATNDGAAILDTSFSEAELYHAISENGNQVRNATYNGHTEFVEQDASGSSSVIVALGDGRYVVGSKAPAEAAVDVVDGNADALSGSLKDAFQATRDGYVRFASTVPQDQIDPGQYAGNTNLNVEAFNSVTTVSGTFYVDGNRLGVETNLIADSASHADDIKNVAQGLVSLGRGMYSEEHLSHALDQVSVSVTGKTVTVTYEDSESNIEAALNATGA